MPAQAIESAYWCFVIYTFPLFLWYFHMDIWLSETLKQNSLSDSVQDVRI